MLVLSRREGEEVVIGGDIRVKVAEVSGNRVKLALVAPRRTPIRRGEHVRPEGPEADGLPFDADDYSIVLVGD